MNRTGLSASVLCAHCRQEGRAVDHRDGGHFKNEFWSKTMSEARVYPLTAVFKTGIAVYYELDDERCWDL